MPEAEIIPFGNELPLAYRIYLISSAGRIAGPAEVIASNSDQNAIEKAKQLFAGCNLEIWQGARVITKLSADDNRALQLAGTGRLPC
jgi:hypothetical protein